MDRARGRGTLKQRSLPLNDAAATLATNRVYASVEDLTVALQTQLAALSVTPEFRPGNESIQTSSRASLVSW